MNSIASGFPRRRISGKIFVNDPRASMIELNYDGAKEQGGSRQPWSGGRTLERCSLFGGAPTLDGSIRKSWRYCAFERSTHNRVSEPLAQVAIARGVAFETNANCLSPVLGPDTDGKLFFFYSFLRINFPTPGPRAPRALGDVPRRRPKAAVRPFPVSPCRRAMIALTAEAASGLNASLSRRPRRGSCGAPLWFASTPGRRTPPPANGKNSVGNSRHCRRHRRASGRAASVKFDTAASPGGGRGLACAIVGLRFAGSMQTFLLPVGAAN